MSLAKALSSLIQQGAASHSAGDLSRAEASYREVLRMDPRNADTLHLLGLLHHQQGKSEEGLRLVERGLKANPSFPAALNSKGLILSALGRPKEALSSFERAIAIKGDYAIAWNNKGNALHSLSRFAEAVKSYDRAVALQPAYVDAIVNRGNSLNALGRLDDALTNYTQAVKLRPTLFEAHLNGAMTLMTLGRLEEAASSFERAIALRPDHAEALYQRALTLQALGRYSGAVESYDRALAIEPDRAEFWNNRGVSLHRLFDYARARESYTRAVDLDPDYPEGLINLATMHYVFGEQRQAIACLDRRLAEAPADARARLLRVMHTLPIIYNNDDEIPRAREEYHARLEALSNDLSETHELARFADVIGAAQPYHLAYQGLDDRDLQRMYGDLVCRISESRFKKPDCFPDAGDDEPIRIGIVSSFFRRHTVWHLMLRAWVTQLDRSRFEVFGYYTGSSGDACTDIARASCHRFVEGPLSPVEWRRTILADAPHIILFPELGMDTIPVQIAAQRLARVQCSSWGHPETSGFPSIDYYLTSDAMEPLDGQRHYTEKLIRLPNLGISYEQAGRRDLVISRGEFGLRHDAIVFWCGQSLYKYLPCYDEVFPRIAREVPNAQFAFIAYPHGNAVTDVFRNRMAAAFHKCGLDAAHFCVFLPRLDPDRFAASFSLCDVVLDSIGWSGGQTTLESLPYNRPIVSMAGPLMRGRHTTAILGLMDLNDTVAETLDEYVNIAARLSSDQDWYRDVSDRISRNQHRLYRDQSAIASLESFLQTVSRSPHDTRRMRS